jgi:Ca2+-binding EF-hand superfamily protein
MQRKSIVLSLENKKEKSNIQKERLKLINEIFDMFDIDGDSKIKSNEIRGILSAMGREPTHDNIMDFLFIADNNNTGIIDKENFMKALDEVFSLPEDAVDQAIEAFKFFDVKKKGKINIQVLKDILLKYVDGYSQDDVHNIFQLINVDNNGDFNYEEFIDIWKFQ